MYPGNGSSQSKESFPLYEVSRVSIEDVQPKELAGALDIPADKILIRDVMVSFVYSVRYISISTIDPHNGHNSGPTRILCDCLDLKGAPYA